MSLPAACALRLMASWVPAAAEASSTDFARKFRRDSRRMTDEAAWLDMMTPSMWVGRLGTTWIENSPLPK